jgi:hypothetical protein
MFFFKFSYSFSLPLSFLSFYLPLPGVAQSEPHKPPFTPNSGSLNSPVFPHFPLPTSLFPPLLAPLPPLFLSYCTFLLHLSSPLLFLFFIPSSTLPHPTFSLSRPYSTLLSSLFPDFHTLLLKGTNKNAFRTKRHQFVRCAVI